MALSHAVPLLFCLALCSLFPAAGASITTTLNVSDSKGNRVQISYSFYMFNGYLARNLTDDCTNENYEPKTDSGIFEVLLLLDYLTNDIRPPDLPDNVFELLTDLNEAAVEILELAESVKELDQEFGDASYVAQLLGETARAKLTLMRRTVHKFRQSSLEQLFDNIEELKEVTEQYWDNPRDLVDLKLAEEELEPADIEGLDTVHKLRAFLTGNILAGFAFSAISLGYVEYLECRGSENDGKFCSGQFFLPQRLTGEPLKQIEIKEKLLQTVQHQTKVDFSEDEVGEVASMLVQIVSRHPEIVTKARHGIIQRTRRPWRSAMVLKMMQEALANIQQLDSIFFSSGTDFAEEPQVVYQRLLRSGISAKFAQKWGIEGQDEILEKNADQPDILAYNQYLYSLSHLVNAAVLGEIL